MSIEILTKQDLDSFRMQLLNDLKSLLQPQSAEPQYLRSKEVKQLLKISAGTLVNLRIKKLLNPTKLGGVYYYPANEIHALLDGKQ